MNPPPDKLEKAIHEALRGLPPRKAPLTLEARVLAEIARRDSLPWWHRSWAYWPTPIRWIFLVLSAALCGVLIGACAGFFQGNAPQLFAHFFAQPLARLSALSAALHATLNVGRDLIALIPPVWLYAAFAAMGLLYLSVFLVGATAYRTLWQSR